MLSLSELDATVYKFPYKLIGLGGEWLGPARGHYSTGAIPVHARCNAAHHLDSFDAATAATQYSIVQKLYMRSPSFRL